MAVKELHFRIGEIRNECNLSLSQLSKLMGNYSRQTINHYEINKYKPNFDFYIKFYKVAKNILPSLNFMYLIDPECKEKYVVDEKVVAGYGFNDMALNNLKYLAKTNAKYDLASSKKLKTSSVFLPILNRIFENEYFVTFIKNLHNIVEKQVDYENEYLSWLISREFNTMAQEFISKLPKH